MTEPARRRATYQDVLDAPDDKIAEIVNGVLHLSPWPGLVQSYVMTSLAGELGASFQLGRDGPGGWVFLPRPDVHLGDDILVPDIAAWRSERMPVIEDIAFGTLAPDWICEVLSRSTLKLDRIGKMASYAAAGVKHAWLVHPIRRTLEVFRLCRGRWRALAIHQGDERVRAEPFETLQLDLSQLWERLAPPPSHRDYELDETCEVGAADRESECERGWSGGGAATRAPGDAGVTPSGSFHGRCLRGTGG
jgi:Uma2 family endonuclease